MGDKQVIIYIQTKTQACKSISTNACNATLQVIIRTIIIIIIISLFDVATISIMFNPALHDLNTYKINYKSKNIFISFTI